MSFISYENGQTLFGKVGNAIKGQEGLLSDTVGWTGKNLLVNKAVSKTESGVTLTVNKNANNEVLSMVLNGTATADINFWMPDTIESSFHVNAGEYILSAGDVELSGNFDIQLYRKGATNYETPSIILRNGDRASFIDGNYHVRIYIKNGTTFSNVTIYPMLRDARISDSTYEPHHDSVDACKYNTAAAVQLGAHNLLNNADVKGAYSSTYTVLDTGLRVISSNTDAWANARYEITNLPQNTDMVVSCNAATSNGTRMLSVRGSNDGTNYTTLKEVGNASELKADFNTGTYKYIRVMLFASGDPGASGNSVDYTNLMLKVASDTDNTYAPYAMTNRELTTGKLQIGSYLSSSNDLNNIMSDGIYGFSTQPSHSPTSVGYLIVKHASDGDIIQTIFSAFSDRGEIYVRRYSVGEWRSWYKFSGTVVS